MNELVQQVKELAVKYKNLMETYTTQKTIVQQTAAAPIAQMQESLPAATSVDEQKKENTTMLNTVVAPITEEKTKTNYYSHPRASEVKLTQGANAVRLNSDAENLLKSMLATIGQFSATYTSTLRTYADQARIMITQLTLKDIIEWRYYGRNPQFHEDYKKFKAAGDHVGFASYLQKRDATTGSLISNHIPGYAIDLPKNVAFEKYWQPKVGKEKGIKKIFPEEKCTHIEFTFPVTGAGSGSGGGGNATVPIEPSKDGSIQGSVGKNGQNQRNDVATIQDLLNKKNNAGLQVDGSSGPKTINAIAKYQQSIMNMVKPDGRVDLDGATWRSLTGAQTQESTSVPNEVNTENSNPEIDKVQGTESVDTVKEENETNISEPTGNINKDIKDSVGQGGKNSSEDVKVIQSLLKAKGAKIEITGDCDEATINAIKDYQKNMMNSSRPDGRVDVNGSMWNHLHGRAVIPGAQGILVKASNYDKFLKEAAEKYEMKFSHLKSIMCVESKANPTATSGAAFGLMQLTKETWGGVQNKFKELSSYGFSANWTDPRINILFGAAALKLKAKSMGVNPSDPNFPILGVTAYNAGEGTVKIAIAKAKEAGSKNPIIDFLKPEYLKLAIKHFKLHNYYLTGGGKKNNKSGTEAEALELKYKEIISYAPKVNSYLSMQVE